MRPPMAHGPPVPPARQPMAYFHATFHLSLIAESIGLFV